MKKIKLPALALLMALVVSSFLISFSDSEVLKYKNQPLRFIQEAFLASYNAYVALIQGSIFDVNLTSQGWFHGFYPLSETFVATTPLILTGLAVTLAFRAGLFNIGAQGQFIFGAIAASYVGFALELPIGIHVIAALIAGILSGALYGGFVGLLKAKTGAHEVIVTIMLNYVAAYFLLWLLSTTAFLRVGRQDPLAPEVKETARLPRLLGSDLRVHAGILIALAAAWGVWWLLNKSTIGFKFRAVGANSSAARTAGISVPLSTTAVMFISGGLAGLAGAAQITGSEPALTSGVGGSYGFDAITVALLGRGTPLGTVLAALLFGALRAGGLTMQSSTNTPIELVLVIQGLVVLFMAAPTLIKAWLRLKNVEEVESVASKGWNG